MSTVFAPFFKPSRGETPKLLSALTNRRSACRRTSFGKVRGVCLSLFTIPIARYGLRGRSVSDSGARHRHGAAQLVYVYRCHAPARSRVVSPAKHSCLHRRRRFKRYPHARKALEALKRGVSRPKRNVWFGRAQTALFVYQFGCIAGPLTACLDN